MYLIYVNVFCVLSDLITAVGGAVVSPNIVLRSYKVILL